MPKPLRHQDLEERADEIDFENERVVIDVRRYQRDPAYRLRCDGYRYLEHGDEEAAQRCFVEAWAYDIKT